MEMSFRICMNIYCGTTSSSQWKTGWKLRSGELANLCHKCGSAYEQHIYCEEFHADDSGWRQCVTCGKRLHCGCIASLSLIKLRDGGGVDCIICARSPCLKSSSNDGKCGGLGPSTVSENAAPKQFGSYKGINGSQQPSISQHANTVAALGLLKHDELLFPNGEVGSRCISNLVQPSMGPFPKARVDVSSINMQHKDNSNTTTHPNLNITLGAPTGNLLPVSGLVVDERKMSNAFHQGFAAHHLLTRPPKAPFTSTTETNVSVAPSMRVARPPVDGRGRHQLLPRYWPRITDQELQQISGDSNCTIVPLFEKVLSASDAGRIGRLVLPKACAEAYFPTISTAEGLPVKIQDVKGKEWVFQFRFWPNNNSRMYVLEGVTPCIQSMQLQAGDTVTFSRIDPEGKLVMGFRKASNSIPMQPMKGSSNSHMNDMSRQLESSCGNIKWHGVEKYGEQTEDALLPASTMMLERKKSKNIGSKTKRMLIDDQDVLALRLTWEEVQGLLRPPPTAKPGIVMIEDYEFEEYEEPPIFGKSSIFTVGSSGIVEQWAQCDSCSKWRRIPADILLPARWICAENAWDRSRSSCIAPDELGPQEREIFLRQNMDTKKRRTTLTNGILKGKQASGFDALANAVTSGVNMNGSGCSSAATTTKHPRHRPGCSCIVCIQPPSGKGKHKSTCMCTVCLTVKRRFKTLMMRKKKRQQSEKEAEIALQNHHKKQTHDNKTNDDDLAIPENMRSCLNQCKGNEGDIQVVSSQTHNEDSGNGLDLNCDPEREEDTRNGLGHAQPNSSDLLQLAHLPLEAYKKQDSVTNMASQANGEANQGQVVENHPIIIHHKQVNSGDQSCAPNDKQENNSPS